MPGYLSHSEGKFNTTLLIRCCPILTSRPHLATSAASVHCWYWPRTRSSCATRSCTREHRFAERSNGHIGGLTLTLSCLRAHKAAHPERYPIPPHVIKLMPHLKDINERFEPTQVHLQVYDGWSLRPTPFALIDIDWRLPHAQRSATSFHSTR